MVFFCKWCCLRDCAVTAVACLDCTSHCRWRSFVSLMLRDPLIPTSALFIPSAGNEKCLTSCARANISQERSTCVECLGQHKTSYELLCVVSIRQKPWRKSEKKCHGCPETKIKHTHTSTCQAAGRKNSLSWLFVKHTVGPPLDWQAYLLCRGLSCESQEWKLVFGSGLTEGESAGKCLFGMSSAAI